uniref:Uncharacterized protein n=1 Tax=Oryza meridionalis TaxID=40149 RepID=A0A0E0E949_9ORYZ
MTAPPMWLPFGGAELRETAVAELEPHVRRLPGQLAQPRTREPRLHRRLAMTMAMSSISNRHPAACMSWRSVGDAVVRDDANSTRRMTVSLMAPSFLARRHANATDSLSSGPPRKTAAIWVPTFWSPWFLAAVVSSRVDILLEAGADGARGKLEHLAVELAAMVLAGTLLNPACSVAPAIGFVAGNNLTVPLRCACPSLPQVAVVVAPALDACHGMTCPLGEK